MPLLGLLQHLFLLTKFDIELYGKIRQEQNLQVIHTYHNAQ